jgi:YggT family protein
MIIIAKLHEFVTNAVLLAIVMVILLMIARLISEAMDLNPFAWTSRTIRRLSDPLMTPMRGGLRAIGVDPKFAPFVVMLITVLVGVFLLQLVTATAVTVAGVMNSVQSGAFIWVLGFILHGLATIYTLLIIIRVIFSLAMLSYSYRIMRFLVGVTEPLLGPLRRVVPTLGRFDVSPIVAMLIVWVFQAAVVGTLLRGAPFQTF